MMNFPTSVTIFQVHSNFPTSARTFQPRRNFPTSAKLSNFKRSLSTSLGSFQLHLVLSNFVRFFPTSFGSFQLQRSFLTSDFPTSRSFQLPFLTRGFKDRQFYLWFTHAIVPVVNVSKMSFITPINNGSLYNEIIRRFSMTYADHISFGHFC